jgi:hypothetical protein
MNLDGSEKHVKRVRSGALLATKLLDRWTMFGK